MSETTPDEIAEADEAAAEAQRRVGEIEQALLDGDPGASAADLVEAEHEVQHRRSILELARDIKRRREEAAAEQARLDRIAALRGLIVSRFGQHEGSVVDAFDAAVVALTPLVEAIAEHNDALTTVTDELLAVQPLPADLVPNRGSGQLHLRDVDVFVKPIDAAALVAEAAWRAFVAAGQLDAAGAIERTAHISRDHTANAHLGVPARADGAAGAAGPSDVLRRTARIVAARADR